MREKKINIKKYKFKYCEFTASNFHHRQPDAKSKLYNNHFCFFFCALHTVGIPRPARTRNVFRFTYHRGVSPNHRTLLRLAHIFEYRLVIAESLHVRGDVHWART